MRYFFEFLGLLLIIVLGTLIVGFDDPASKSIAGFIPFYDLVSIITPQSMPAEIQTRAFALVIYTLVFIVIYFSVFFLSLLLEQGVGLNVPRAPKSVLPLKFNKTEALTYKLYLIDCLIKSWLMSFSFIFALKISTFIQFERYDFLDAMISVCLAGVGLMYFCYYGILIKVFRQSHANTASEDLRLALTSVFTFNLSYALVYEGNHLIILRKEKLGRFPKKVGRLHNGLFVPHV